MTDQNFSYKRQAGSYNSFSGKTPKKRRKTPLGNVTTGGTPAPNDLTAKPRPKNAPSVNLKPMQRRYSRG